MIRVLLVDDHVMIRAGLERLLEQDPGIDVVAVADRGAAALELDAELHPDVAVIDISMPDMDGIETTRRLIAERPDACVVMLTAHTDRERVLDRHLDRSIGRRSGTGKAVGGHGCRVGRDLQGRHRRLPRIACARDRATPG